VGKLFSVVLAVGVFVSASSMITRVKSDNSRVKQATDAAYRDGLFLGQLDATQGRAAHISIGRWSSAEDRESFTAGYKAGYGLERESEE
jgi:hypothetical protein